MDYILSVAPLQSSGAIQNARDGRFSGLSLGSSPSHTPPRRTTVASLRADRLETYSSGSAQDLHLFPSYSDERVSIGSPSLQRYIFLLIIVLISPIGLAEFFYRY